VHEGIPLNPIEYNKMDSGRKQVKTGENRIKIGESFFPNRILGYRFPRGYFHCFIQEISIFLKQLATQFRACIQRYVASALSS
jgi:hypothetical protein